MVTKSISDLLAFLAVAEEGNFTKAASQLGVSQSTLSHNVRRLEDGLGVRLLTRTTRSLSLTDSGDRLMRHAAPRIDEIKAEMAALSQTDQTPSGTIRITSSQHAAETVLWPVLRRLMTSYPTINAEISVNGRLVDIVAERFDAGIRLGEQIAKDMVAVRIGPQMRMAVVGSPAYFATRSRPVVPDDLLGHDCINIRLPGAGSLHSWSFSKAGHEISVRVDGRFVFNSGWLRINAALAGLGLARLPEYQVMPYIQDGRLVSVLDDWCEYFPGFHLYYPSRKHPSTAFSLLVEALRYRGE